MIRTSLLFLHLALVLVGPVAALAQKNPHDFAEILAPLVDPAKLDSLKSKRAATPRLRKACYWLEEARRQGRCPEAVLKRAYDSLGLRENDERSLAVRGSLLRNLTILERLGCLDQDGMKKLRSGKAPTVRKGRYVGELATGDHIIPRSVAPELDNKLFNLEFLPETLNQRKGAKVGDRQIQLARQWNQAGLLSDVGLSSVRSSYRPPLSE